MIGLRSDEFSLIRSFHQTGQLFNGKFILTDFNFSTVRLKWECSMQF